jgi:mevalonate kinase
MITMTGEQVDKIDLLDKLFGALSVEQLKAFTETEQVVAILKGTNQNPSILKRIIQEHDILYMDVMQLKTDNQVLKNDFKELMKALNTALFTVPYNQDFQNLKSRHSLY